MTKYEGIIETYKKKLEDLGDMKRQIKYLEEKNNEYMQNNLDLEEELGKVSVKKPQLEVCFFFIDLLRLRLMTLHSTSTFTSYQKARCLITSMLRSIFRFHLLGNEKEKIKRVTSFVHNGF